MNGGAGGSAGDEARAGAAGSTAGDTGQGGAPETSVEPCTGENECTGRQTCTGAECSACTCLPPTSAWLSAGTGVLREIHGAPDGGVYVRLSAAPWFARFDADGKAAYWSSNDLPWMTGFAVASDGSLYLSGANNGSLVLAHLAPDGMPLSQPELTGFLHEPNAIAAGDDGKIYVSTEDGGPNNAAHDQVLLTLAEDASVAQSRILQGFSVLPQRPAQRLAVNATSDAILAAPTRVLALSEQLDIYAVPRLDALIRLPTLDDSKLTTGNYVAAVAPDPEAAWVYLDVRRTSATDSEYLATLHRTDESGAEVFRREDIAVGEQALLATLPDSLIVGSERIALSGEPIESLISRSPKPGPFLDVTKVRARSIVVARAEGSGYVLERFDFTIPMDK